FASYSPSLHDALPIYLVALRCRRQSLNEIPDIFATGRSQRISLAHHGFRLCRFCHRVTTSSATAAQDGEEEITMVMRPARKLATRRATVASVMESNPVVDSSSTSTCWS